ncbi:aminotransferase class I/II-fold pyridoxal phosphate-dependent enzyme [Paeniglutamicibacter antarcticus]|uniref:Aminotransferase class I/II-fold pyridoxal phosphate-dependent enzyme n=1 Tax=Paeniglutamicibacter antarcticus TaxID=494023 RepID=A0ABP9TN11_9MICC
MNDRIFMSLADVGEIEEEFVLRAMRSGWIAPLGPDVDAFEKELADRVGVEYSVALSSGTAALHLALLGLGIGKNDIVLSSTLTFAATANAIVYTGAEPYFIDADPETGNMDPQLLRAALENLAAVGRQAAAIVPVDLLGKTVDYSSILEIAAAYGVPVVCDAAESLGATHNGQAAGSFGRASIVSFNGNKIMTTSGGGMLLTNDGELASQARYLATQARQPVAHYEHVDIGYNYRMSNILAALGRAQLSRLDAMIQSRRELKERYRSYFGNIDGVEIFGGKFDREDNHWLTSILVDSSITGWTQAQFMDALAHENIESRPLWKPMHLQPVFAEAPRLVNGTSEKLFETGLTLPSGSSLLEEQIARVFMVINKFITDKKR